MKKQLFQFFTVFLAIHSFQSLAADSELRTYVKQCQTELGFTASEVPALDCNKGDRFDFGDRSRINDFVVYHRVNDKVDLVAACRWGGDQNNDGINTNQTFISLELIIHNRDNGATCFFGAKDGSSSVASNPIANPMVSPTNFSSTRPNADDYWLQPTALNNRKLPSDRNTEPFPSTGKDFVRCVECHSQGPYIASRNIVPFLAKYGLINDGHDMLLNISTSAPKYYRAVGSDPYKRINPNPPANTSAFKDWNSIIYKNLYIDNTGQDKFSERGRDCSSSCHEVSSSKIGSLFPDPAVEFVNRNTRILPSIKVDIDMLAYTLMPPYDEESDYRWINLDTAGNGTEAENFATAKSANTTAVPTLFEDCDAPLLTEVRAVGSLNSFIVAQPNRFAFLPGKLSAFNLKDGLTCLNADQETGQKCENFKVRYECQAPNGVKTWTDWYNTDSQTGTGDNEARSRHANVCSSPTGSIATSIEASVTLTANGWTYTSFGPNDRLAHFSQYGLTCNNADQPDGKCSNYMVRYNSCTTAPVNTNKTLTNVFVTGKQLTAASSSLVKGQAHNNGWSTQLWAIEPVPNTEYVRVRNANAYLNVTSQAESAVVGTAALNTATSQMWLIETVSGSSDVRLKNLWTGKYLTIADPKNFTNTPDYLPIYSQALNTTWSSQRWKLQ